MSTEATEAALVDRVAGAFGFPGANADEGEAQTGEQQTAETNDAAAGEPTEEQGDGLVELEWDNAKYRVPAPIKEAVMRNDDYTRKTQELAEKRRTVEQAHEINESHQFEAAFARSIADESREIGMIDAYLKEASKMDLTNTPTDQLLRQKIEIDAIKERRSALHESINGKRNKFTQDMQARIKDLRGKAKEIASKSIKGFGEETEKTIREYAKSEGLTDREIDNAMVDPRFVKSMWKASQFDKIQADTAKAGEQATRADKGALRPGVAGRQMPKETANKLNFAKAMKNATTSGQKAQLIEGHLGGIFSKGRK